MAAQKLAEKAKTGEIQPEDIDENCIANLLYTKNQPDPDLIIRTSGEQRTSNFLMWQGAYSELLFTDVYWPDFSKKDFDAAIEEYHRRERRFGGLSAGGAL